MFACTKNDELYKRIFEPAIKEHSFERKELIIVPDDILFYFPFEMLVAKFEQDKPRYLLQDHAVSYSASVSLLNPELKRQREPYRDLLALGNPAFEKSKAGITRILASMFKTIFRNEHWVPLPYSENEVKNISKNFKNSELLIGIDATERKFKQTASQYRYLHLATHYLADDRQPMFSKIVFAQDPDNTKEDGYLHTFEVFNLELNAELVTLSACNTALGQFRRGEGLIGVSRAFMYAGVPSLVVSLWPVEDESTAYLMSQFYKYLARGDAKNVALQKAKIDLIKSDLEKNDPFYWAPFVLIGDWK
ncbi:MAG: CHAT domain-containing protein [bacterium]